MSGEFWGAVGIATVIPLLEVIAVFSAARQRLIDHEKFDEQRFMRNEEMLTEIRTDIKELLQRTAGGAE